MFSSLSLSCFLLLIDQKLFTLLSEIAVYYSYDRIIIFLSILMLMESGIIITLCSQTLSGVCSGIIFFILGKMASR